MPDAEYSFSLTESSPPGRLFCRLRASQIRRRDRGAFAASVAVTTPLEQNGRLGAPPKLGREQTPIELLTPHADEAVFAKKRAGRN